MKTREKKEINPLVFGAALTLSFAGFLVSRIRFKPAPSSPSDVHKQVHSKDEIEDDVRTTPRTPSYRESSSNSEAQESPHLLVRIDNISSNSTPSTRRSSGRDGFLLPEFNELIKDFNIGPICEMMSPPMKREAETPISNEDEPIKTNDVERDEYEHEIESLKTMVRDLRERERSLETELLEYYGLKEQETTIKELQNRLKISNVETKVFSMKLESMKSENRKLLAKTADYSRVVAELEAAKANIDHLKEKLRTETEQNKEKLLRLEKRVRMLQLQEQVPEPAEGSDSSYHDMLGNLLRLEDLENECEELRKSKLDLERKNSELAQKLESTQILAGSMLDGLEHLELEHLLSQVSSATTSLSPDTGVDEIQSEVIRLREENETLAKEVERLHTDRCSDAEELVYLRWVNACLQYEIKNAGETHIPKLEAEAKKLILELANNNEKTVSTLDLDYDQWSSSQSHPTSDIAESDELCVDASSTDKARHPKKPKFLEKLRRLVSGKDKDGQVTVESSKGRFEPARFSAELNRLTNASAEDAKEMETARMNGRKSTSSSRSFHKQDRAKELPLTRKTHRKSASHSAACS